MRVRTRTALGIELGERCISVALVERGAQGLRTIAAARGDLPALEAGESGLGKVLSGLLGQLGRRGRVCRAKAAVAVSVDPLVMQLLDLPQPVPTNLSAFVMHELQQYVALSGRSVVSDFCGVGSGVQKRLLAAAADADQMETMVKTCRAAGIVVDAVEPALLAYARAALERQGQVQSGGDVMIALLGARTLTMGLFRRGALDFVRTRPLPADPLTPPLCRWLADELQAVARYYGTQISPGTGTWRICVVVHDGAPRAQEIASGLAAEAPARSFTVVDVCESMDHGHEPAPAQAGDGVPNAEFRVGGPHADAIVSQVAVGAALTLLGVGANGLKVNLLPRAVREARLRTRRLLLTVNAGLVVFLALFVASGLLMHTTGTMARRMEQTRLAAAHYATGALIVEEGFVGQEIVGLQERVEPLRRAMEGRQMVDWPGILQAVRQAIPAGVSVTQLYGGDGRTVAVKGLAPSCPAAEAFVRSLERQSPFESVSLATLERRGDAEDRLEYRIECLLKPTKGVSS
jgi:Tfp pilus assembly protein PilN